MSLTGPALDTICPLDVGSKAISVSPADASVTPRAGAIYALSVDYSSCDPEGVSLPLVLTVTPPSGKVRQRDFRLVAPTTLYVRLEERGRTVVILREFFHNRWLGKLALEVA